MTTTDPPAASRRAASTCLVLALGLVPSSPAAAQSGEVASAPPTSPVEPTARPTVTPPAAISPAPPPSATTPTPTRPWRLAEAVGSPSWLRFGLEQRLRYEHLQNDFRAGSPGDWNAFVMRTLVTAELRFEPLVIGFELEDSRVYATDGTPLNTLLVDAMEPLQAYAGLRFRDLTRQGDQLAITAGRMTLDLGSRRLVARNDFRNTINAFTGVDAQWTSPGRHVVRTFAVMPVIRRPADAADLAENAIQVDLEDVGTWLFGAFYASPALFADTSIEAYVLGLAERDTDRFPSANRRLVTPGFRLLRRPERGEPDYQLEVMGQLGRSHATAAASDVTELDHRAFAIHAEVGYRFDVAWAPRLSLQWEYASGDRSPTDDANNRFDPLYGARRFDFGPTSLYGAFSRSNLDSPAFRIELEPHRTLDAAFTYRAAFVASARDAWVTANVRDPSGQSGTFIGHHLDGRIRYQPFPRNLALELGGAYLSRGEFAKDATGGRSAPVIYVYTQITGTI